MKQYPCMETCSYFMFQLAFLIPWSSNYTASGVISLGTHAPSNIHCISEQREALLQFKQGIKLDHDDCGLLTSWVGQECCQWYGVHCSNHSSHVISLHLGGIGSFLNATQILSLSLRSNNISGKFPISLCQLSNLQILDLSYNQISGILPECICHLQGMTNSMHRLDTTFVYGGQSKPVDVCNISEMLMWKRKEHSFENTLGMVNYMVISDNRLQGQIPGGISNLTGLESLDLARNNFTGSIPAKIGELKSLEFLDLSSNHLSGQIPSTLANLNFLGTLNVSYNPSHRHSATEPGSSSIYR